MFKKIFFGLLLLIIIAFGGLSYYVSTINWNRYKTKITNQIEDVTGKKVVINGQISLKFLPKPHLRANDIKIYNSEDRKLSEPIAEVKEMVTDLSLMPLIHKRFVIDKMNLVDAKVLIEFLDNGKTNWYSDINQNQNFNLAGVDIAFNSVMLQNSTVRIIDKALKLDVLLNKLNADISAQSLIGPFRIDGNFIKDNTPAGFALNVGTLTESFATSLNLVLTHPSSDSYARFDGSVQSNNSEIQGNFTIESQKPSTFLNTISSQTLLPEEYNYPLAASIELSVNPRQIDLSSFVVKYGERLAGSGKVLIPLQSITNDRKKIDVVFEMTDLDLMPLSIVLTEYLKKFDEGRKTFEPALEYDVIADIVATRAHYNNDIIRNFKLSADIINNILTIKDLSGLFPGDTEISLTGDIFENEKQLSYNLKTKALSQDFLKFLEFTGHKPQTYAQSTYRNARSVFEISGNLKQIKIMPFEFGLDKIDVTGAIGIKRDRKNMYFLSLQSENINFDNYLKPLSDENKDSSFADKVKLFLNDFKFFNKTDMHAELALKLGIYNNTAFENLNINLDANDGVVNIKKFDIDQIASSKLQLQGKISNIGNNPTFENFKCNFETDNFATFKNKLGLNLPDWPLFKTANTFQTQSILSGTLDNANINIASKVEKINTNYTGKIFRQDQKLYWRGNLELKAPDFVDFANQINLDYNPDNLAANVFNFKADIEGSFNNWRAKNMDSFIGANNFTGAFAYLKKDDKPAIKANIAANMFEFDRFISMPSKNLAQKTKKEAHTFIERPSFDKTPVNYDVFKNFDLIGKFKIKNLSYIDSYIENVDFLMNISNGNIEVKNLTATKNTAPMNINFVITNTQTPTIKGDLTLTNYPLENFGGSIYNIKKGQLSLKANYESQASSIESFINNLQSKLSAELTKAEVEGIDIEIIEDDLSKRNKSDDFDSFLKTNLSSGKSAFEVISAAFDVQKGDFIISDGAMLSPLVTIDISGNGSFVDWNMNTAFKMRFNRLTDQNLPITFHLKENISNPVLSVDASELKNKYDSHWAKIEQEAKEKEEARLAALKKRMSETQERRLKQVNLITAEINPRIQRYKPFSSDARIRSVYESIDIQAQEMLAELRKIENKAMGQYEDKDIDEFNLKLDIYDPLLTELITQLDDNYIFDLRLHIANTYKTISDIYENSVEKSKNYQNTLNSYAMRLVQLNSLVVLNELVEVKSGRDSIEESIRKIADMYTDAFKIKEVADNENKIPMLDKHYSSLSDIYQKSSAELRKLNTNLEDLFIFIQDVIYFEQTGKHKTQPKQNTQIQEQPSVKQSELVQSSDVKEVEAVTEEMQSPQKFEEQKEPETISEPLKQNEPQAPSEVTEPVQDQPEPEIEEPEQPLLIEITDDYTSKTKLSGTVTKKGKKSEIIQQKQDDKPLLRPIVGEVLIDGNVTRN